MLWPIYISQWRQAGIYFQEVKTCSSAYRKKTTKTYTIKSFQYVKLTRSNKWRATIKEEHLIRKRIKEKDKSMIVTIRNKSYKNYFSTDGTLNMLWVWERDRWRYETMQNRRYDSGFLRDRENMTMACKYLEMKAEVIDNSII